MDSRTPPRRSHKRIVLVLVGVLVAMFLFAFALVPLYDALCRALGINGKTGDAYTGEVATLASDVDSRPIIIHFTSNTAPGLPVDFHTDQRSAQLNVGDFYTAYYTFTNLSDKPLVGQAVPSVAPGKAAVHMRKLDCFCFSQQTLGPNESRQLLVRFFVDAELPSDVNDLTLSYTFYPVDNAPEMEMMEHTSSHSMHKG